MATRKLHSYLVTYRIHNGYMYNEPNGYDTTEEIIRAHNKEEAYEKACKRADTPSVIAHDPVTVLKKDVERLPDEKLRNYKVTLYYHTNVTIEVAAENEEEARRAAYANIGGETFKEQLLEGLQEDDSPDVEEI